MLTKRCPSDPIGAVSISMLSGDASRFAEFTFKSLAPRLASIEAPFFAVGAMLDGEPIGLATGIQQGTSALLLSIKVAAPNRRRHIAKHMIACWESAAADLGATTVSARFTETMPGCDAFLALVDAAGWEAPVDMFYQIVGRAGAMARAGGAWTGVARRIRNNASVSYLPLQFRPEDGASIARLLAQPQAVTMRDPRVFLADSVTECSTAIRRNDELVGWILAIAAPCNLGAGTREPGVVSIQYLENYLDADLWHTGASIGGYHHCFSAQAAAFGETSLAIYRTHPGMPRMVNFSMKRFAPLALRTDVVRAVSKEL